MKPTPSSLITALVAATLILMTFVPADERLITGLEHHVEHALAFGLLGFCYALSFATRPVWACTFAIVFCLILELAQIPLSTRHARLSDFIVDSIATIGGLFLGIGMRKLASLYAST